jgi:hypothetical protein
MRQPTSTTSAAPGLVSASRCSRSSTAPLLLLPHGVVQGPPPLPPFTTVAPFLSIGHHPSPPFVVSLLRVKTARLSTSPPPPLAYCPSLTTEEPSALMKSELPPPFFPFCCELPPCLFSLRLVAILSLPFAPSCRRTSPTPQSTAGAAAEAGTSWFFRRLAVDHLL